MNNDINLNTEILIENKNDIIPTSMDNTPSVLSENPLLKNPEDCKKIFQAMLHNDKIKARIERQTSIKVKQNNLKQLGVKEFQSLTAFRIILSKTDIYTSKYSIPSMNTFSTEKKVSICDLLYFLENKEFTSYFSADDLSWFQYRCLVLALRFHLFSHVFYEAPFGRNIYDSFVLKFTDKNIPLFKLKANQFLENRKVLNNANDFHLKPNTRALKKAVHALTAKSNSFSYIKNLLADVSLNNPPKVLSDVFVFSLILNNYFHNKPLLNIKPEWENQLRVYLEELILLFELETLLSGSVDFMLLLRLIETSQLVNIPMESLTNPLMSHNAFNAIINVFDLLTTSYYLNLNHKLSYRLFDN